MNEQLIVKNFGPIKDATVDFKRVTVFIGPTGGGKSTLAKLAAIGKDAQLYRINLKLKSAVEDYLNDLFDKFDLTNYKNKNSSIYWTGSQGEISINSDKMSVVANAGVAETMEEFMVRMLPESNGIEDRLFSDANKPFAKSWDEFAKIVFNEVNKHNKWEEFYSTILHSWGLLYIPAERIFTASVSDALAGLIVSNIALPKPLLEFSRQFEIARKSIGIFQVNFLSTTYDYNNGANAIILKNGYTIKLSESASGIQTALPLLVATKHCSSLDRPHNFIIEEPELNLFPSAQLEVVKTLIEYCTSKSNTLILTTHSPYVLTALNLLCYAYRIAQQDEATAKKVAKLIPRHCWIDPDQFAAYYVDRPDTKRKQQVRSIINKKTGLIEENELDTASDELGAIFDKLVRLRKPTPTPSRAK